ncbi:21132_t:CDS:2 [Dentiscutata erythropus]|uniref:21132_t:CDS:1 n=1 Tax=Dentiscutata erythropus TaxID=1348616 RepID=A0A9N9EGI9_9GLOM|nr:21132_t:CDS:2 [Dentiscutata erythropus]
MKNKHRNIQKHYKKDKSQISNINLDNINIVEDLLLVNTTSILQKVYAVIFLSLDKLCKGKAKAKLIV